MEMRTVFHKKLREIQDDILAMGSMVSKAILRSIDALKNRDLELAHQIIADDQKVNGKRFEIEEKCIQLIATQQPTVEHWMDSTPVKPGDLQACPHCWAFFQSISTKTKLTIF